MNFGINLKNAIKSRGYDIDEVAIQIDVDASTLYGYAENLYYPQFDNLCEICNRYLIPPNELFDGMFDFKNSESAYTFRITYLLNTLTPDEKVVANKTIDTFTDHLGHKELKNLGARIRRLRQYKKLTADKLAKEAHLAPSSVRNIEANNAQPSVSSLLALAGIFQVSPDYLLCERVNIPSAKRFSHLLPNEIALLYDVLNIYFN
ncbi:MAG: helix-turn-helix domain-containing protein [Lachnospiraceae bacterium]